MTIGYISRPKRGPKPIQRKATTVRYSLDIWHQFEAFCKQEGVSVGNAQNALLTWYVTARTKGQPVPSLQLDKAIVAPQVEPPQETAIAAPETPTTLDPWVSALSGLKQLLSIDDYALLAPLELKALETAHDVNTAFVWVETKAYGLLLDQRGLREQLRAALQGAANLENLVLYWQPRKKNPPVSSPAVEIAPIVVATPVANEQPSLQSLAPGLQKRLGEFFEIYLAPCRVLEVRAGMLTLGVPNSFFKEYLEQQEYREVIQEEIAKAGPVLEVIFVVMEPPPLVEIKQEPIKEDLASRAATQLRNLYQKSQIASKEGNHQEAAKLGQEAVILIAGLEQATLDEIARRNPAHARLWWGWTESVSKKQAQESVYKSSQGRGR